MRTYFGYCHICCYQQYFSSLQSFFDKPFMRRLSKLSSKLLLEGCQGAISLFCELFYRNVVKQVIVNLLSEFTACFIGSE